MIDRHLRGAIPGGIGVGLLLLLAGTPCAAHDPGLSALDLRLSGEGLDGWMTCALADLEAAASARGAATLESLAGSAVEALLDGSPVAPRLVEVTTRGAEALILVRFGTVDGSRLSIRSALLADFPWGHRQRARLRDGDRGWLADRLLDARTDTLEVTLGGPTEAASSFPAFLLLGVEHILLGFDHLAFLLCLLLAGGSFATALRVITAFSVAHSITLALAALDLVRVPPAVVEPLIAASIVYVGVENLLRRRLARRWPLAFGFGLIHGLGFASALRETGLGAEGWGMVSPLLAFNLGVEAGQVAIAAVVFPVILALQRRPAFTARWVPAVSFLVASLGAYWLVERSIGG